ncbi:MAG TPA: pyridoxamine 5'-phosphate oxidase family protein [Gemmatimonadota bacterium]|nr:pyridoxamine 5'-phosphate oxidase family protein [Gemmatimonadota bacterium]
MRGRTMERLDRDECIKLMERHPACVGRVALAGPRPVIFPVNYAIDRGNVVFRTDPGTKFDAAVHESYVAFEADWVGPSWQIGWSVVVRGQAHVVTGPEELQRVRRLPLLPCAEGDKEKFVSVDTMLISGRRFNGG